MVKATDSVVLLVEDDPGDQEMVRRALSGDSHCVDLRTVGDGEEAIDYLLRRNRFSDANSSPRPSLILLDLNLPRMGGKHLLAKLRANPDLSGLRVVVWTTSTQVCDRAASEALGCDQFISKPSDALEFIQAVRSIVRPEPTGWDIGGRESTGRLVLLVEDDDGDAEQVRRYLLDHSDLGYDLVHVHGVGESGLAPTVPDADVILLDYRLGSYTGLELLEAARKQGDIRPVVILTNFADEYAIAKLMGAGADSYLAKRDLSTQTLQTAIAEAKARANDRRDQYVGLQEKERAARQLEQLNLELTQQSRLDGLTRTLNRRAWSEAITMEHDRSRRLNHEYAVLMLDVDHFKRLNDSLGHAAGDQCLQQVAAELVSACRSIDFVGRYGGEEFAVLCPESSAGEAYLLGKRLRDAIRKLQLPNPGSATAKYVTISVGVAGSRGTSSWDDVVKQADQALYAAKNSGRNRVHIFTPQSEPHP